MQSTTDHSYGVIPFFAHDTETLFLLVQHADGHWSFPKGHREEGESVVEAALRELHEETGIALVESDLLPPTFSETYTFTRDAAPIQKTVDYRLGRVSSQDVVLDVVEVVDAAWLPYGEALDRITFSESRQMLAEAYSFLSK